MIFVKTEVMDYSPALFWHENWCWSASLIRRSSNHGLNRLLSDIFYFMIGSSVIVGTYSTVIMSNLGKLNSVSSCFSQTVINWFCFHMKNYKNPNLGCDLFKNWIDLIEFISLKRADGLLVIFTFGENPLPTVTVKK